MSSAIKPAQICAPPRPLDDRIGEMLRRNHHGLIRPLWADAPEIVKQYWRDRAPAFQTLLAACGLKVVIDEGKR
jgi:hypothetical protein